MTSSAGLLEGRLPPGRSDPVGGEVLLASGVPPPMVRRSSRECRLPRPPGRCPMAVPRVSDHWGTSTPSLPPWGAESKAPEVFGVAWTPAVGGLGEDEVGGKAEDGGIAEVVVPCPCRSEVGEEDVDRGSWLELGWPDSAMSECWLLAGSPS